MVTIRIINQLQSLLTTGEGVNTGIAVPVMFDDREVLPVLIVVKCVVAMPSINCDVCVISVVILSKRDV